MTFTFSKFVRKYLIPYGLQASAFLSTLILISPIIWMVSTSLKKESAVFDRPPVWIPSEISFDSYFRIMNGFVANILYNSILVALFAAIIATVVGALTAYALSRFAIPGKSTIMLFFLSSLAFPIPLLMMSMYILLMKLGLLDTYLSMIIGHSVIT